MKPKARVTEKNESDSVPMWKEGKRELKKPGKRTQGKKGAQMVYYSTGMICEM